MRVRNMAVVGAAMVAAWAGGAGIAQATPVQDTEPTCSDLVAAMVADEGSTDIDPCEYPLPDDCDLPLLLSSEADAVSDEAVLPEFPCTDDITIDVEGDCENPETFTFIVNGTGLEPNGVYAAIPSTADLSTVDNVDDIEDAPFVLFRYTADANGDVKDFSYSATESAGVFDFPTGAFRLYWATGSLTTDYPTFGYTDVEECTAVTTEPVVVTPPAAQPTTPAVTTPVVAPVAVTPVAAHPAVLANTGAPVTSAALLGGGLLVAGAGALVATRRRAS